MTLAATMTATTSRYVADEITADIASAAYAIYRQYKKWVTFAELHRLVSWWVTEHPQIVIETPRHITSVLRRVAEQRARKLKADKSGYKVDDEQFYSTRAIVRMLPYALDPTATPPAGIDDDMAEVNKHHKGREGFGGWEAALADIRVGLGRLSQRDRNLLTLSYVKGVPTQRLAYQLGMTREALVRELRAAVKSIQRTLGGARPVVHEPAT